ncbi:MAG: ribosomal protein S18-alanine N-acetyltransferase [Clostridia bacterium]|nr:ribosomal protein S18-alanine N-acetyltransferase [Clostridia bacterium]
MEIVKLNSAHIDKVENLLKEQFGNEAWNKSQIASSFNSNSTHFYGIFDGETLITVASILVTPDDINLLDIATSENYKHKGYAKTLLKYLLTLKDDGQTFSLEVKSKNTSAINLYTKLGFKTLTIRKKYYKDGDDALCMFLEKLLP